MSAIVAQSPSLPSSLDPLSSSFSLLSTSKAPEIEKKFDDEAHRKKLYQTSYEPSPKLVAADQATYVKPPREKDPVPEGFPERVEGSAIWDGKELITKPELWLHVVTNEEIADVERAIEHYKSLKLPFSEINQSTFPLTVLKTELDHVVQEVHHGLGVRVLRGLPVHKWDRPTQIIAFAGITSYIGNKRLKQQTDSAIVHLRDITRIKEDDRPPIVVKGQTAGNQVFHTDAGDVIALFTLGRAETGGLSQLTSIGQVYNDLAGSRRDILRTLADKWHWKGAHPNGQPLIHHVNNRVIAQYARRPFFSFYESKERAEGVPELTAAQHIALDTIHYTAEKYSLDLALQPGDLEYANNLTTFHARTESEDSDENVRHLLRLWVRNEEHALQHGEVLDHLWEKLTAPFDEKWPLEAWDKVAGNATYQQLVKGHGY